MTPASGSRSVLPIPSRTKTHLTTYDAKDPDTSFPAIEPLLPPEQAPNVLVILLDDVGFAASSAFGGPCPMPNAERLADNGLKFTRFHTTALCAPTRQALLTGRNHHAVGMGAITEIATSAPGYSSVRPNNAAPLAETLKLNGYSTAQFGKCHEVPVWQTSPMGPFEQWPTGSGFEYFYGFLGGETNQYFPALFEGTRPIEPPATPEEGYHFTDDMTDKAIGWVRQQKALMPNKPFFMYYAPGATHAPHQVPEEWADRHRGKFAQGWDVLREQIFARQKELGVIPADAELTRRPDEIPAYDDMPAELKPVLERQMEVYAGFLEHTDHHIGRLLEVLDELEVLNDTLVYFIIGDNGASAEGNINGSVNEMFVFNGAAHLETPEYLIAHVDSIGSPAAYNHYAVGWAHAMCTPYQWTKQIASHWGGTRNGTIVSWPNGFRARGEIRNQFHHVIDVAATVLDVAGLPEPDFVNGLQQMPLHGVSMAYCFDDASAPEARETQYFEMVGNRGIYHKGWTAVTKHRTPWVVTGEMTPFDEDIWELYDTSTDWTQARDLSAQLPERLAHLQRLFLLEASKYNVFPLDDRAVERFDAVIAGRPSLIRGTSQKLFPGMGRLPENTVLNLKNHTHSVTAQVNVPADGAQGVIVAQGGAFAGWSFYIHEGRLTYCYNLLGLMRTKIVSEAPVPAGAHQVRMEFTYDGGGLGKGADIALFIDGVQDGAGRLEATVPLVFSGDETCDLGADTASPVSDDYTLETSRFTGTVDWVQLDVGEDDNDHLITAADMWRVAMARQ